MPRVPHASIVRGWQKRRAALDAAFWDRVDQSGGATACWPWTGSRLKSGYGVFLRNWRDVRAHREAYELVHGPIPPGLEVRHTCDNPPCCNPTHLVIGTHADNMADMVARRRAARGEQHPNARLTDVEVRAIRALYAQGVRQVDLARRYGISRAHICEIVKGRKRVVA